MVEKDKLLVVVSVLEGRQFPKRPRHKIVAEARFDGELISTDPVDHVEHPDFTQELAWELDKKGLQQHRLQRTSIKIQCYAVDSSTSAREAIGYVVLDLRSAQNKQTSKWHSLLLSKYHKTKPEVRLSMYVEEDKTEPANSSFKAKEAPARLVEDAPVRDGDAKLLKPILNEDEGFYQLGPAKQCADQFVLSVTIATATNLAQLIPSTQALPAGGGYFFYFSLFGNDVTNEIFHDLINPTFPAERASVRLRSSVDAIRMFLSNQPGLQVHLCCGEQSLGRAEVPLNTLLKKNSTEIYMKPVSVEGTFELVPPNRAKQQLPAVPGSLLPVVGVSVVLRKEDNAMRTPTKEGQRTPIRGPASASPVNRSKPHTHGAATPTKGEGRTGAGAMEMPSPVHADEEEEYGDDFEQGTHENVSSLEEDKNRKKNSDEEQTKPKTVVSKPPRPQQPQSPGPSTTSTTQHHVAIPPQSHHFSFSIDLRSVKCTDSNTTQFVFLRYTYPFFGSAAPILTHPPVEMRKGTEVLLPQSFCAFDFACNMQQIQETFLKVPLLVETWHRDKQLSKDVLIGAARLPLGDIIVAEKTKIMNNNSGQSGWKQLYSNKVPVISSDGHSKQVGEISFVLSLEDWGPIGTQQIVVANQESSGTQSRADSHAAAKSPVREPRETEEYKAALELEMWKEEQEHVFENQLKQKEMMYMKALAEEWKKRDRERELLMKKKLTEYAQLEEQLRKTLQDLEKREKQLAANEQEVMRLKNDLQREHDRKLQEMKEASRRMKDDCDHLIDLEKAKSKELENIIQRYKDELTEAEKRRGKVEKEFLVYKEELNTKPEVRLQSEINLLTLEKVELERKLDAMVKSKIHYKQQWGRALKELARLKQKEQAQAKAHLHKQQQELEHMRLRYLAAEEKEVVNTEKQELEDIKQELNKLKKLEEERLKSEENSPRNFTSGKLDGADLDDVEEHISRLIEERDTLLRTGVYTTQDRIIAELDRQIREAMSNKKLNNV